MGLLIVNHPDRASDQWMWTPSISRDRRIGVQDRSTRFFGTDFSFEDLEERDVDQYDYRLTGEESLDGAACWRIEARPRQTKASQYTLVRIWIRKDDYVPVQYENLVQELLVRGLINSDLQILLNIWWPRLVEMTDVRLLYHSSHPETLEYNVPFKDDDFTLQALRRGQ